MVTLRGDHVKFQHRQVNGQQTECIGIWSAAMNDYAWFPLEHERENGGKPSSTGKTIGYLHLRTPGPDARTQVIDSATDENLDVQLFVRANLNGSEPAHERV